MHTTLPNFGMYFFKYQCHNVLFSYIVNHTVCWKRCQSHTGVTHYYHCKHRVEASKATADDWIVVLDCIEDFFFFYFNIFCNNPFSHCIKKRQFGEPQRRPSSLISTYYFYNKHCIVTLFAESSVRFIFFIWGHITFGGG